MGPIAYVELTLANGAKVRVERLVRQAFRIELRCENDAISVGLNAEEVAMLIAVLDCKP